MRLVREINKVEIVRRFALQKVGGRLRDLTANLLRVTHGAGMPRRIVGQTSAVLGAMIEYREAVGRFPANELASELDIDNDNDAGLPKRSGAEHSIEKNARQAILRGAMQVVASRLLGQRMQEVAGDREMLDGIRDLKKAREHRRKRRRAELGERPSRARRKK